MSSVRNTIANVRNAAQFATNRHTISIRSSAPENAKVHKQFFLLILVGILLNKLLSFSDYLHDTRYARTGGHSGN